MKRKSTIITFRLSHPLTNASNEIGASAITQISNSSRVLKANRSFKEDKENQYLINRTVQNCCNTNTKKSQKNHTLAQRILPGVSILESENPFNYSDLIGLITQFLHDKNILNLLFINKLIRSTLLNAHRLHIRLTPSPFTLAHQDKEKIQFSQDNNLSIKIHIDTEKNCQDLTSFINNPHNEEILNRIESLDLGDIYLANQEPVEKLLEDLSKRTDSLKNLTSFSCKHINFSLKFPEKFLSLNSFKCGNIYDRESLILPKELNKLTSFSCLGIGQNATLSLPLQLASLSNLTINKIMDNVDLALPKSLPAKTNLTIFDIGYNVTFKLPQVQYDQLISQFYFSNLNESLSCY